jgi:hypothetical protein
MRIPAFQQFFIAANLNNEKSLFQPEFVGAGMFRHNPE